MPRPVSQAASDLMLESCGRWKSPWNTRRLRLFQAGGIWYIPGLAEKLPNFLHVCFWWNHDVTWLFENISSTYKYILYHRYNLPCFPATWTNKKHQKNPSKTGRLISWSVNHNPVASCFRVLLPRCISDRPLWLVQIGGHRTVDVMDVEWHGEFMGSLYFFVAKNINGWLGVVTITLLSGPLNDSNSIYNDRRGPPYLGIWRKFRWSCCGWDEYYH